MSRLRGFVISRTASFRKKSMSTKTNPNQYRFGMTRSKTHFLLKFNIFSVSSFSCPPSCCCLPLPSCRSCPHLPLPSCSSHPLFFIFTEETSILDQQCRPPKETCFFQVMMKILRESGALSLQKWRTFICGSSCSTGTRMRRNRSSCIKSPCSRLPN